MKGPLARIRRRRGPAPEEQPTTVVDPPAAPAQPPAPTPPDAPPATSLFGGGQPAAPPPATDPVTLGVPGQQLPADTTPEDLSAPSFRDRGRLRRRLRYLRRVRELGFRDLGGLVFDLDRFGRQGDHLVRGKLAALRAVDAELRALERALDDRRDVIELREPGIAACPRCGALHGSDARYCPSCGVGLRGPRAVSEVANVALVPQGPDAASEQRPPVPPPAGPEPPAAPPPAPPPPAPPASEQPTVQQPAAEQPTTERPAPHQEPPAPEPHQPAPEQAAPPPAEPPAPEPETGATQQPPAEGTPSGDLRWDQPAPPADPPSRDAGITWDDQPTEVLRPADQADQPDGTERPR